MQRVIFNYTGFENPLNAQIKYTVVQLQLSQQNEFILHAFKDIYLY